MGYHVDAKVKSQKKKSRHYLKKEKMNRLKTKLGEIEFRVLGQGRPILVLHGGHSNMYDPLAHRGFNLNRFKFIIPSRPGYGKTTLHGNKSPRQAADLILLLMDNLNISCFDIMGISAGGPTALELAARNPSRIKHLLLISAVTKKWMRKTAINYRVALMIFNPWIESLTWRLSRIISILLPIFFAKILFGQVSTHRHMNYLDTPLFKKMIKLQRSGSGFVNDLAQEVDKATLSRIKCQTLILHSYFDNAVGTSHVLKAKMEIKNAHTLIIKNNWGHLVWLDEEYESLVLMMSSFLNDEKGWKEKVVS